VAAVEAGQRTQIQGEYPAELRALTGNLNGLLAQERSQQTRLGNALGDLAHSLRTPLAVLHGAIPQEIEPQTAQLMKEQIQRMDHIIGYQLQRARSRAGAAAGLAPPVPIRRLVERICASLDKVYREKGVRTILHIDPGLGFRGTEGDLMELWGNLLENAYKWARGTVRVTAAGGLRSVELTVEDDGVGIPAGQHGRILERGARVDEGVPGHGIGLAIVREICASYGGHLEIDQSGLGGALFRARLGP
jgi:two-component system sensor histidine kinase PhoQ